MHQNCLNYYYCSKKGIIVFEIRKKLPKEWKSEKLFSNKWNKTLYEEKKTKKVQNKPS